MLNQWSVRTNILPCIPNFKVAKLCNAEVKDSDKNIGPEQPVRVLYFRIALLCFSKNSS